MQASRALPRLTLAHLRRGKEGALRALLLLCALSALAVVAAVVALFVYESLLFFRTVPLSDFLGGTRWAPIHEPAGYGILPLIGATLVITAIALTVAVPLGFLAALFLAAYAPRTCGPGSSQSWRCSLACPPWSTGSSPCGL